jgi:hypothetical protein
MKNSNIPNEGTQQHFQPASDNKARESASDVCAAINAIILESGFDDATRAGLMAAMDAASGRTLPFPMADKYLGRRITRHSSVAVEHGDVTTRRGINNEAPLALVERRFVASVKQTDAVRTN